ncbi:MAG: hypothetical protein PWQ06_693 [Anaerophaga sp.]|nr:hypothetical protein [Anaerophaga sp.]
MTDKQKDKLVKIIESCRIHVDRINGAYNAVKDLIPLNSERFTTMSTDKGLLLTNMFSGFLNCRI